MRLICPNCDAQYEVGEGVIPADGRDVQCSNCGHTWFQYPEGYDDRPVEELEDDRALTAQVQNHHPEDALEEDDFETSLRAALDEGHDDDFPDTTENLQDDVNVDDEPWDEVHEPISPPSEEPVEEDTEPAVSAAVATAAAASAATAVRRELPDDIADILRAEAQRESEARSNEPTSKLETQSDLGLDEAQDAGDQRAEKARRRMAQFRMDGEEEAPVSKPAKGSSRRAALPDIEDINSTLRATTDRKRETAAAATDPAQKSRSKRAGFRTGFYLMILVAIVFGVAYVMAPQIIEMVPMLEPYINMWVGFADQMRWALDDLMRMAVQKITELTG